MGDIHFSQGDGEITFCGAIEMPGWIGIGVDLIKDGAANYGLTNSIVVPSPVEPHFGPTRYLLFEGHLGRPRGQAALRRRERLVRRRLLEGDKGHR
jgi:acetamidase/formamidase